MEGAFRSFGPIAVPTVRRLSKTTWDVATYADRTGYQPGFIEGAHPLPLPGLGQWQGDAAPLLGAEQPNDEASSELKCTHFSVRVSKSRRLPFYSAVNVDGAFSDRDTERTDVWRFGPRIEEKYQIMREVYGTDRQGFFSRGHMTRREDPNWGNEATTKAADADTFHVTNAAPQRQLFNAGIWLDLENYVLSNADRENLRIGVVTGPVFTEDDPDYYGVRVPVAFWKIVAFKHAVSRNLTAIAYRRSQATFLPTRTRSTFNFGDFEDTQVSVAGLAEETGLDLSKYIEIDVLKQADRRLTIALNHVSDMYLQ